LKQYTIIGGVNGVGKSSLSGVLRHQLPDMGLIIDPQRNPATV
jgi:predicted ABC-type ATPase